MDIPYPKINLPHIYIFAFFIPSYISYRFNPSPHYKSYKKEHLNNKSALF